VCFVDLTALRDGRIDKTHAMRAKHRSRPRDGLEIDEPQPQPAETLPYPAQLTLTLRDPR
jgi:hypothetical protein